MSRFPSLPANPQLGDVFKRFPDGAKPLIDYHDILLRGPSPLTVAQREVIAAYVSGVNACRYCHGAHRVIAELQGADPKIFEHLMTDLESSGVEPTMIPVLAYVRKLTERPAQMTDSDAQAVYAAGWNELALFHAISICALFNFMNRIIEGCGIRLDESIANQMRARHQALIDDPQPYAAFGRQFGVA